MNSKQQDEDQGPEDTVLLALPPLPPGWCWTTLRDISEIEGGITKDQKRPVTTTMREVPYLRVANVQRGYFELEDIKMIHADERELKILRLKKGDILFTEGGDRDKLGRGWVWNDEIQDCIHQNHIFRARPCLLFVDPKFVSYHGNFFGRDWFTKTGKQTTNLASINKGVLSRFPVPLAPINEQYRIVAKIEELFSDLHSGVENLKRVQGNLKRYRAAVLKAAVEGKLTEDWRAQHPDTEPASVLLERILTERRHRWEKDQIAKFARAGKQPPKGWQQTFVASPLPEASSSFNSPDEWAWTTVEVAGEVRLGRQRSPKDHQGPHMRPYLRVANVYEDRLDLSDVKQMNFTPQEYETFHLKVGDILLNEGQSIELVGRPAMYRGEVPGACFQNTLVRFRAKDGILTAFALIVFRAYLRNQKFQRIARWTVNIAHLGADRFAKMGFPIPSSPEQEEIIADVERRLSVIDAIEAQVVNNLKRAARLRQGILKRAFEGRLVPQDPTDEPADKFLERIREQRKTTHPLTNGSPRLRKSGRPRKSGSAMPLFNQNDGDEQGGEP